MRGLQRLLLTRLFANPASKHLSTPLKSVGLFSSDRPFSSGPDKGPEWSPNFGDSRPTDGLGWDVGSSWSVGLTKEHFDGEVVGKQVESDSRRTKSGFESARMTDEEMDTLRQLEEETRKSKAFVSGWNARMKDIGVMMKQVIANPTFLALKKIKITV